MELIEIIRKRLDSKTELILAFTKGKQVVPGLSREHSPTVTCFEVFTATQDGEDTAVSGSLYFALDEFGKASDAFVRLSMGTALDMRGGNSLQNVLARNSNFLP